VDHDAGHHAQGGTALLDAGTLSQAMSPSDPDGVMGFSITLITGRKLS
jgi:hypothetical protein